MWGHVIKYFLENFYTMGYNLKNARNGKSASKIPTKMAKFEPPVMKE